MSTSMYDTDLGMNAANFAPLTPLAFLRRSAVVYPDKVAVIHAEQRYTYRKLAERVARFASALKARGIAVASFEFAGEGHGFRNSDTVITALEAELSFYGRILGLEACEELAEVEIANFGDGQ